MKKHPCMAAAILLALTSMSWTASVLPAAAADTSCPEGSEWIDCMAAEGDRMAIYVKGRSAYENARETGDFSEALRLSRQLVVQGDKNGERLLKMTYMQLGWGAHKDYPQAYAWLSEGINGGDDYLVRWREMLIDKMTPEQLTKAKALAGN